MLFPTIIFANAPEEYPEYLFSNDNSFSSVNLFIKHIKDVRNKNEYIEKLINEAKLERQQLIDSAEIIEKRWKKGKNISRHLQKINDQTMVYKNTENFNNWIKDGGKNIKPEMLLDKKVPKLLDYELKRNTFLNSVLQQARRENSAIKQYASFALEAFEQKNGIIKYYIRFMGKDTLLGNGCHVPGVSDYLTWPQNFQHHYSEPLYEILEEPEESLEEIKKKVVEMKRSKSVGYF